MSHRIKKPLELYQYGLTGRTPNQKEYIKTIDNSRIVLCQGPYGSGKTHIAVARGILGLYKGEWNKLILSRPLVQAGEDTGILPGPIKSKLDPYIRPLLDELRHYLSYKNIQSLIMSDIIEIVPLAYMRGRNFHQSYIVLDEATNSTFEQLEIILTRIGNSTKLVLVGDPTQSDLSPRLQGGFLKWCEILKNVEGISIVNLKPCDIVRDGIVKLILEAKEKYNG